MRALALATLLSALPALAHAQANGPATHGTAPAPAPGSGEARTAPAPAPGSGEARAAPAPAAPTTRSAPPSGAYRALPAPAYRPRSLPGHVDPGVRPGYPRYLYDPYAYSLAPLWWGWGWGYGYYPLYPRPESGYAPEDVDRINTRLAVNAGVTLKHGGGAAGLTLGIEGERLGVHLGLDGLYPGAGTYGFDSSTTYGFATAHLTAALVATDFARLRLELGGSMLSYPDAGPDAGLSSFGPDVGLSGSVSLVGPLGVEGYVRVTPLPIPIVDVQGALALRFGPVALTGGWRDFSVRKSDQNSGRFAWSGPQVGLGFRF